MRKAFTTVAALALLSSAAMAQGSMGNGSSTSMGASTSAPAANFTVKNYYGQSVYDRSDNKIGTVDDVLIDKTGKITGLIIGVGGFLGVGTKDVQVAFDQVQLENKNNKWQLSMDANKDQLKSAQGLKYDSNSTTWVADNGSSSTGTTGSATGSGMAPSGGTSR